jgi:hypothetical protein
MRLPGENVFCQKFNYVKHKVAIKHWVLLAAYLIITALEYAATYRRLELVM